MTYKVWTNDPITPVVGESELAQFLRGVCSDDPLLTGNLIMATSAVIEYLRQDLTPRTWNIEYADWPVVGTVTGGLAYSSHMLAETIQLPYAGLQQVDLILAGDEEITDYKIIKGRPDSIRLAPQQTSLSIKYVAGFDPIPEQIRQAVLMVAAYLYIHAGACEIGDAVHKSGASALVSQYRAGVVLL